MVSLRKLLFLSLLVGAVAILGCGTTTAVAAAVAAVMVAAAERVEPVAALLPVGRRATAGVAESESLQGSTPRLRGVHSSAFS